MLTLRGFTTSSISTRLAAILLVLVPTSIVVKTSYADDIKCGLTFVDCVEFFQRKIDALETTAQAQQATIQAQQKKIGTLETTAQAQQKKIGVMEKTAQAQQEEIQTLTNDLAELAHQHKCVVAQVDSDEIMFCDRLKDSSFGPEMVVIPAGTFRMGDLQGGGSENEQPVHEVSIKRFAMSRFEVTFAEYDKFADATGREKPNDQGWGRGNRPVINVSWEDATAYADWLSEQTGHQYRLPTEAEWEYAARAGTETKYYWGNDPDEACGYANVRDKTFAKKNFPNLTEKQWKEWKETPNRQTVPPFFYCTDGYEWTAPVGLFQANAFGLFDVLGNVREWTCSEYEDKYAGKEQRCAKEASLFVLRGGSWYYGSRNARTAYRYWRARSGRYGSYGARLARIVNP